MRSAPDTRSSTTSHTWPPRRVTWTETDTKDRRPRQPRGGPRRRHRHHRAESRRPVPAIYDDELLGRHFITGDGRGNENIGLTTVHFVFHAEHNRLVEQAKDVVLDARRPTPWRPRLPQRVARTPVAAVPAGTVGDNPTLDWNGERIFQAARFGTEMQYQHLVFEEFARKIQPEIDIFAGYTPTSTPRSSPSSPTPSTGSATRCSPSRCRGRIQTAPPNDLGLIEAFLNPVEFDNDATPARLGSTDPEGCRRRHPRHDPPGRQRDRRVRHRRAAQQPGGPAARPRDAQPGARSRHRYPAAQRSARREFFAASGHTALDAVRRAGTTSGRAAPPRVPGQLRRGVRHTP